MPAALTHVCYYTEIINTRILPRTIENHQDFVQNDLLPSLPNNQELYHQRFNDNFRLATRMDRMNPVYIAGVSDRRQALEDFMQEWFSRRARSQEYLIYVIIERRSWVRPEHETLAMTEEVNRQLSEELELERTQRDVDAFLGLAPVQSLISYYI